MPSCTDLDETVYDKIPAENFGKPMVKSIRSLAPAYNTFKNDISLTHVLLYRNAQEIWRSYLPVKVVTGMMVVSIVSYTCTHGLRIPQP